MADISQRGGAATKGNKKMLDKKIKAISVF